MTAVLPAARDASWRERAATLTIFLALGLDTGTWAAAIPALKAAFDLDAAHLSLVLLTISIASMVATIGAGIVTPRIGNGRATALAALATTVGFAAPGLAGSFPQLIVCGAVLGFGAGSLEVSVNGHASDIERRWRATIMSSFHAAFSIGGLLGATLGGLAAATGAGLQGQLWMPLSLSALLVLSALPSLGPGAQGEPGRRQPMTWPARRMLVLGLVAMLGYLLEGAMADWSALYLTTVAAASAGLGAAGYAAFSVTMAIGRLTGDRVVARLGPSRVLVAGGLVAAVGLAIAVLIPSPWTAAVGFAFVGFGAANVVPLIFSAAGRLATSPAAGIALVSSFGFVGFLGGPPLIGFLATWFGLRFSFVVLVGVAVLMALFSPRDEDQRSRRRSRT